jgi:hypothetical protein
MACGHERQKTSRDDANDRAVSRFAGAHGSDPFRPIGKIGEIRRDFRIHPDHST